MEDAAGKTFRVYAGEDAFQAGAIVEVTSLPAMAARLREKDQSENTPAGV